MFSRRTPNLAVLGFIEFASAAYDNFDKVAELIVADATADPSSQISKSMADLKKTHRPNLTAGRKYVDSARHANYVEVELYLATLADVKERLGLTLTAVR